MATTALPSLKAIRDLLTDLLGRDVTIAPADPLTANEREAAAYAVYVDERLRMSALLVLDLPLAAYASAAIGLVPAAGAEAAIDDRVLPPVLHDNFFEVCNIIASLFNTPGAPHLKLYAVHGPSELPPSDVATTATTLAPRLDAKVDIRSYGTGQVSVILA